MLLHTYMMSTEQRYPEIAITIYGHSIRYSAEVSVVQIKYNSFVTYKIHKLYRSEYGSNFLQFYTVSF